MGNTIELKDGKMTINGKRVMRNPITKELFIVEKMKEIGNNYFISQEKRKLTESEKKSVDKFMNKLIAESE